MKEKNLEASERQERHELTLKIHQRTGIPFTIARKIAREYLENYYSLAVFFPEELQKYLYQESGNWYSCECCYSPYPLYVEGEQGKLMLSDSY